MTSYEESLLSALESIAYGVNRLVDLQADLLAEAKRSTDSIERSETSLRSVEGAA